MSSERPTPPQTRALREECLSHLDALYGAALRMTGNREDGEDLVQDTVLKAIRNLHRYRDEGTCKAWLFRILTNTYIDRYRKARRTPTAVEFDDERATGQYARVAVSTLSRPDETDSLEVGSGGSLAAEDLIEFLSRFVADEVKAAVDRLPDIFRETIVLRDIEGFTYRETAEMLEIPIGTVMSRLYRGRHLLQEALRDYAVANGYARTKEAS